MTIVPTVQEEVRPEVTWQGGDKIRVELAAIVGRSMPGGASSVISASNPVRSDVFNAIEIGSMNKFSES